MRRGVACGILGGVLFAASMPVGAAEPRTLSRGELQNEAKTNEELKLYLDRNGLPDVAEARPLSDKGPWDANEVALYYLDARREIAFSRAFLLGDPTVSVQRIERALTDEDVAALAAQPSLREGSGGGENVVVASVADGDEPDAGTASADLPEVEVVASLAADDIDFTSTDPADRAEAAAFRAEQAAGKVEEAAIRTERAAVRAEGVVDRMVAAAAVRKPAKRAAKVSAKAVAASPVATAAPATPVDADPVAANPTAAPKP